MIADTLNPSLSRAAPDPVVDADNVVRRYGAFTAVDGVTLRVERGECVALLGPNGAGKTTLSRMIGAVAPRDGGGLRVFGLDPWADQTRVKSRIGWVMQQDALDEDLDAAENLLVWADLHGLTVERARARSAEVVKLLGLDGREGSRPAALSGGYRRRLAIARALLAEPEFLILDEPTTGLDSQVRHALWDVLRRLRDGGLTILVTTHYMEEAARIADRVVILHQGKLVAEGAPGELVRRHLRRYVLEVRADEAPDPARIGCPASDVRRHGDRALVFHDDESVLRAAVSQCAFGTAIVRPSSLEDVFLDLTGSSLGG
ncbi:MAG: ABC transporter ATP-binding protein [Planctomycetes bacterium]|nr:ABC transporter ATP-binding protein [Planctomycetota bacterium]